MYFLADPSLKDVFKSTSDNMNQTTDPSILMAVLACAAGMVILLALIAHRKKRVATPKPVNHQGKLLKEIMNHLPLRNAEIKQLRILAEQQDCSSPLVMLLCPSLLAKAMQDRNTRVDRKILGRVAKKISG